MKKTKIIALILGVIVMSLGVGYLAIAWTDPGEEPPAGNVSIPLRNGEVITVADSTATFSGNIVATANNHGTCAWQAFTCNDAMACPDGYFMVSAERNANGGGALCGTAGRQWYQMRIQCCQL